jgi:SAM-dependent methyltransferase
MQDRAFDNPVDIQQGKLALDKGCGTGIMTLLLAEHLPNAIYSIDLPPVQDSAKGESRCSGGRVHFIEGNILELVAKHKFLRSSPVDFSFHCTLAAGLQSYMVYLRQAIVLLLKPGGWVEMQDFFGLKPGHCNLRITGLAVDQGLANSGTATGQKRSF